MVVTGEGTVCEGEGVPQGCGTLESSMLYHFLSCLDIMRTLSPTLKLAVKLF